MALTLTRKQREALHKVFVRKYPHIDALRAEDARGLYRRFRRTVQPEIGGSAVMIRYAGMWVGIEKDGYTHS